MNLDEFKKNIEDWIENKQPQPKKIEVIGGKKYYMYLVDKEIFDFIHSLTSPISWEDLKKVFIINNAVYHQHSKPCRCAGVVKKMIAKLKKQLYYDM